MVKSLHIQAKHYFKVIIFPIYKILHMSVHVLLNLLREEGKRHKIQGFFGKYFIAFSQ